MKKTLVAVFAVGFMWAIVTVAQELEDMPPELRAILEMKPTEDTGEEAPAATAEDDGIPRREIRNWADMVEDWMTPRPVPKAAIVRLDGRYAYPHPAVRFKMEIVREEGDTVWLKGIPPEDPESKMHNMWLQRQAQQVKMLAEREMAEVAENGEFVDIDMTIVPPPTVNALEFENVRSGLPEEELWQMSIDLVDMNDDGIVDIVAPPTRKGTYAFPAIFLGDGKGGYRFLKGVQWSSEVPFDYGSVRVTDFDDDGHLDIVIAIHFKGQYVLYGTGNKVFRRFEKLPAPDPRVTSRAVGIGDFDKDGRKDVVFQAELDVDLGANVRIEGISTTWIVKNKAEGWKLDTNGIRARNIGDRIHVTDLDGDGYEDVVVAANATGRRNLVFFNRGEEGWKPWDSKRVLGNGYHFDATPVATGEGQRIYGVFEQFQFNSEGKQARTGLVRYLPTDESWTEVESQVIWFDDNRNNPYFRLAAGDLDGDGLEDIVAARKKGGLEVWLQASEGEFYLNKGAGLNSGARCYDIHIVDLNGDGNGDILASMADEGESPGGIRVWLTRPRA